MIKDRLSNAECYYGISDGIKKGFEWLRKSDLLTIADGRYEIDGERIYANVQSYETKDEALYEAHRRYADIQYMIKGAERAGVINYTKCAEAVKYDEGKDIEFLDYSGEESFEILAEGDFLIFFPQDAHKPSLNYKEKKVVKKVVVKVLL